MANERFIIDDDSGKLKALPGSTETYFHLKKRVNTGAGVVLLVDGSGSMCDKLVQAKAGATDFSKKALADGTAVGVAVFADTAELLCETSTDVGLIKGAIAGIGSSGSTNMAAGIELATLILGDHSPRTIVLVTDGCPNSRDAALLAADKARLRDIDIFCIGVDGADMGFLDMIATVSDMAVRINAANLQKTLAGSADRLRLPSKTK